MKKTPLLKLTIFLILMQTMCFSQNTIMDSLKMALKNANHDTLRCNILNQMVEEEADETIWPKYNEELKQTAENNLKKELSVQIKNTFLKYLAIALNNIAYQHAINGKMPEAIENYTKCMEIQKQINDKKGVGWTLNSIGNTYRKIGDATNALKYYELSLANSKEINDKEGEANCLYFIGWTYDNQGDVLRALENYNNSLKIQEQLDNKDGMARTLNNIAYIYNNQGDTKTAMEYYMKSFKIYEKLGNVNGVASSLNNMATIYYKKSDLEKANEYYNKSYLKFKSIDDKSGMAYTLNNLGNVANKKESLEKAIEYYNNSLSIRTEINDMQGISQTSSNLGEIYYKQNKYNEAEIKCLYGLKIAKEIGYPEGIKTAAGLLFKIYEKKKDGLKAFEMHKLYITMRDSINNIATQKAVITQYAKYTYEKKSAADSVRVAEEKKVTEIQLEQEKTQRYTLYGGLLLVLLFLALMFNRFKITQKQKIVIEKQKEIVDKKQKEIVESITYAKRLQEAILPPENFINENLPENFILYKPKDIVAGDFYWAEKINDLFFISAADSTGHGVPGAMVSVVCSTALNRAVKEFKITDTGKILDKTRELVLETFEKSASEVKDGMDISLLCVDTKNKKLFWSGANNPLWYIQNNALNEIKGDKQPIGKTEFPKPFTTHEIEYKKDTTLFLFTDGYADQFGGEKGKKFKYKQLSELLFKNNELKMAQQKTILVDSFEIWKGELEQVDDVCVIGIRI